MIGVFDSGIGGLTVVKEIFRQLPGYDLVYFGDTARTPYGNKSPEVVRRYALEDADFLLSKGAKLIVVACNTVSATAMPALRQHLKASGVPIFEVVTPAVAAAARSVGPDGRLAVIGTRATVNSGIYEKKLAAVAPGLQVRGQACPLFVPLVEEGWLSRPEALMVAKRHLAPIRWPEVEAVILGCTHYPFIKSIIRKALGSEIRLIDPAKETARTLRQRLDDDPALDRQMAKRGRARFYVSDLTEQAASLATAWLGRPVKLLKANLP